MTIYTSHNPCLIRRVREEYGCLGNMSRHPVEVEGWGLWGTTEHAFQAMRFDREDPIVEEIRAIRSPMQAKWHARAHHDDRIVQPLSQQDLDQMYALLRLKHATHEDVRRCLTSSGQRDIIEDCTSRPQGSGLFWGAARQSDGTWSGQNALGKLWMKIRDQTEK